jgi:hypothetical protein
VESRNAERVRLRAERDKLRATDPEGLADAWAMIEDIWTRTIARRERMDEVRDVIADATAEELERNCVPPDSPGHPRKDHSVLQCLHVILKEEWQHHRYAVRDLEVLEKRPR